MEHPRADAFYRIQNQLTQADPNKPTIEVDREELTRVLELAYRTLRIAESYEAADRADELH